jgi:gas vesicle protein
MPDKAKLALTVVLVAGAAAVLIAQPAGPEARDANSRSPKAVRAEANRPIPLVTDQQEADLLRALEEKRPEEAKALKKLKEESPREYRIQLAEAYKNYQFVKDMPPEIQRAHETQVRVRVEAWRTSREYLAAVDPALKDRLHSRLQELLGQEFDADQTIRDYRLNQLEEQLKQLRAELKERADRRSQVIGQSLQELLAAKVRPKPDAEPRRPLDARPLTMPAK